MSWYTKAMLSAALALGIGGAVEANPIFIPPPAPAPIPVFPRPVIVNPAFCPPPVVVPSRRRQRKALERYVEAVIRTRLAGIVRDVDVDVERDGDVEIEVESRHPLAYQLVRGVVYSLPQLRGYRIEIDID
jgi:hypothetical protein